MLTLEKTPTLQPVKKPDPDLLPDDRVIDSRDLFGERREIVIEHDGSLYRLKITRQGKLILNK